MSRQLLTLTGLLALLIALLFPVAVSADVNDFTITDFTADYYLSKNDPQGALRVVEHIKINFTDFNHGILRAIPDSYKGQPLKLHINKVSSDSGAPSQFTTYGDHGNTVLKIGDPDRTVTSDQSYTIDYTVQNVVTFYSDHDELYWDINGNEWPQPFDQVTANLHLPNGLTIKQQTCYTGGYGSTLQTCEIQSQTDGATVHATRRLQPYETLTTVFAFPKGYFKAPTKIDWLRDHAWQLISILIPPLVIGGWAFKRWYKYGKDIKGRGVIIPEYSPPDGLSPAEAGVLMNYKLESREVSATIIDLAIRKYLRIIEVTEKKILKDKKTYEFELLKPDFSALKPHEIQILNDLFESKQAGERISLSLLKNKFYKTIESLQSSMPATLTDIGYFPKNPNKGDNKMLVVAGLCFGLPIGLASLKLSILFNGFLFAGLILSGIIVIVFLILMPKRTVKGVAAMEAIEGLKMYMETAEKDRIAMLQSPDAPYVEKSNEPNKTVELFEKLLPYAIVLGVENEWAKQFEDIYKTPPGWYAGNWTTFNVIYLTSSLNNSVSAMGTSFSPPSSSGGSGFGGGGFAGGGGGGGGGGGW